MSTERKHIGVVVWEQRSFLGMTRAQLAERSGVNQRTLRAIESGSTKSPEWDTMVALAEALDLSLDDLEEWRDE